MTALLDRPIASGSTLYQPSRPSPALRAAQDFYERGAPDASSRTIKITAVDESASWLASFMETRLNSLLDLRPGWDGGHGAEVTFDAALSANRIAFAVSLETRLAPQIFPLADGGVQLEWHAGGQSLEIEIDADGEGHVLAVAADGTVLINDDFGADSPHVRPVRAVLREIAARVTRTR